MRLLFRRPQQLPFRVWVRRPLMSSFPDKNRASHLCPFILRQQLSLREPHLYPELHPALVPQQPPFRRQQWPSHLRLFRAT